MLAKPLGVLSIKSEIVRKRSEVLEEPTDNMWNFKEIVKTLCFSLLLKQV